MRFLADMGVDLRVVEWLRREGHDAAHGREVGLQRSPDMDVLERAISEGRTLLTFDLDFGEIVALTRRQKASVVLFRLRNTRAGHLIERLRATLADCTSVLERGAVVVVEESRHRVRLLPIGGSGSTP